MPKSDSAGKPTLNVLFISLDKNLLREQQGDALRRHLRYAKYFNKLNTIVFTTKKDGLRKSLRKNNLLVIPTNSISRWFYVWDAIKIASKLQKIDKINIISTQDPFITVVAGICIKKLTQATLNIQIHNDFSSKFWKNEKLQNRIYSLLLPVTIRFADSIRAVSETSAKIAPDSSKVFIAPVSVDLDYFKPTEVIKTIDLIGVGRLVNQKNFSLLIKSVAELVKKHPQLKVRIIGEGTQEKQLKELIERNKLSQNIKMTGEKNRQKVRELLQKSKILVLPSVYEGLPLVAIEAAACGLPVVMSDVSGAREIVKDGETGYTVPINNISNLNKKLKELLQNSKLRKTMGREGRNWVESNFQREFLEKQWIEGLISKTKRKSKVCFILPELDPDAPTHYPYTIKLFNEYAEEHPTALFIEKGKPLHESSHFEKVVNQNILVKPFNLLERLFLLTKLRIAGYNTFYIHYSYWSLFLLKIISIALPTKIFYWHAEEFHKKDLEKMKLLERFLLKTAIKTAPTLVTAGEILKKAYAETFDISANKITILPNWIEVKPQKENKKALQKKLGLPQKKNIILFVHRLSERKGAHILPEIINKIQSEIRNVHFLIIGSGKLRRLLENKIRKKDVTFTGNVPQKNIRDYYQAADVFIMPSFREGFPRVILEAMAAGLPIVTSNAGEVSSILPNEQKEYIVPTKKINNFVYVLQRIMKDEQAWKALGERNKARAKKFNLKNATNHLVSLIGR